MQVQRPTRWKDLTIAKCPDAEAFFEGILWNKGRSFLFYLFVCLFALQNTHWSHPKGDAASIGLLHKKVKAGCSVFMLVCVCISSFLESVFFFFFAKKLPSPSQWNYISLKELRLEGACSPRSEDKRSSIPTQPPLHLQPPQRCKQAACDSLRIATHGIFISRHLAQCHCSQILHRLVDPSQKKQVIVVKWYLRSWKSTPCVKSACCEAKAVIQKLYASSTESASWCCELKSQRRSN